LAFNLGLEVRGDDARLDDRDAVDRVDVEDTIHARDAQHDAAAERYRAAREPAPHGARGQRDAPFEGDAVDRADFGRRRGEHDHRRRVLVEGAVETVGDQVLSGGQQTVRDGGTQRFEEPGVEGGGRHRS
jgi:hypothetical protein